jgi:signal transduction histidine kinase
MVAMSVALVLFALPLAILVRSSLLDEERGELERLALWAAVRVGPEFRVGDPVELPAVEPGNAVGVYDPSGHLKSGRGPDPADAVTRQATAGTVVIGEVGADMVAAVPVSSAERVIGVVRASDPMSAVWARTLLAWSLLAALAGAALAIAFLVARGQARRLTEPLECLAEASERIAGGDLGARAEPSSIPEINRVAATHNTMVDRLTQMLEQQSHFSADASHQLRTPLAGLLLELEASETSPPSELPRVIADAAARVRSLTQTVEDLLALAREHPGEWLSITPQPVGEVIRQIEHRWHGALAREGRRLILDIDPAVCGWPVPQGVVTQIVEVLADNALRHGRGTVTLSARDAAGVLAVAMADEGTIQLAADAMFTRGISSSDSPGIGLALARTIAEAGGGRLTITGRAPTSFTLYLPLPNHS